MQCPQSPARMLSEDQFICSICLEVFVEPVSTPCGHTFCKACLGGFWSLSRNPPTCPMCKKTFTRKPELSVNCVLAEIAQHFSSPSNNATLKSSKKEQEVGDFAKVGDVPCDFCIGRKLKAVKSCVTCPGSFCEAHLRNHKKGKSMLGHKMIEPIHNVQEKVCATHKRMLDAFCRNECVCVCKECAEASHKGHEVVTVDREGKKRTSQLGKKRSELKHLIKEREKKLDEIKQSIRVIKEGSEREMEESWAVMADLQKMLENSQADLIEQISSRQKEAELQAKEAASSLEHELNYLRRKSSEMDTLAQMSDTLMMLQLLPTQPPPTEVSDWSTLFINTDLHLNAIRKSISNLSDKIHLEVKRLYAKGEVILDPTTAQRDLCLSEDGRQVRYEEQRKSSTHSDTPRRFSPALFVLGLEAFSTGRHYWEVDVGNKTAWTIGVARGSVRRKGDIRLSPEGGFWCLWLKNAEVKALTGSRVNLHLAMLPQKLGVFLDYEAGQVSFYDVKSHTHLYTFSDSFTESVYPIFSPCINKDGKNPGMATPTSMLAEEQVHCSICLDVFTNPVSIPCGHNFCMACIGSYWKSSALFMCPMCKKTFIKQPDISINTVLREIAEKFKEIKKTPVAKLQKRIQEVPISSPVELPSEMPELIPPNAQRSQEVSCDVCTGPRRRAQKSCLVCLTSYCEEHLKTHNTRFTKHKLIEPVKNLEDRMCKKHERLLELFCKKDQTMVCVLCTEMDHRAHYTVPVEREWNEKKGFLRKTETEVQQMIQERLKKGGAQQQIEDSMQVFSDLIRELQKTQAELVLEIEEKQRKYTSRANTQIQDLETEIKILQTRNNELENLSQTEDHIHFLQNFPSLISHPQTRDWSEACVHPDACVGTIRRAVLKLEDILSDELDKLAEAVDVTFDPDTANPWLQLSEDGRQMRHLGSWQDLPDTPERFDTVVQVGQKDDWYLGVARTSVRRKGRISVSSAHGYWALAMKKGLEYRVSSSPPLLLSIQPKLKRVGVYVDYEEGQVSFYNLESRSHIYTFMDSFQDKLFPFFYLYCSDKASDSMLICDVQEMHLTKQC
ncbi:hypothetical protein DNTS_016170 [Danionella cerebrum]|uniref:RING-type E3 ubiquitin transferase n=1 Tax=Danionella cerebrum TaxID=2873325 RepID=A0A553MRE3_9TELE|nr:hypothetical protein DNTS_016170 [Danionella translucida]